MCLSSLYPLLHEVGGPGLSTHCDFPASNKGSHSTLPHEQGMDAVARKAFSEPRTRSAELPWKDPPLTIVRTSPACLRSHQACEEMGKCGPLPSHFTFSRLRALTSPDLMSHDNPQEAINSFKGLFSAGWYHAQEPSLICYRVCGYQMFA